MEKVELTKEQKDAIALSEAQLEQAEGFNNAQLEKANKDS